MLAEVTSNPNAKAAIVFTFDGTGMMSFGPCIEGFAREHGIAAAQLTGIGACNDAVLGFFDWETKDYRKIPVIEQIEVVSGKRSPQAFGSTARRKDG
jgi:predicted DNA-binding protein with PD1-like motif